MKIMARTRNRVSRQLLQLVQQVDLFNPQTNILTKHFGEAQNGLVRAILNCRQRSASNLFRRWCFPTRVAVCAKHMLPTGFPPGSRPLASFRFRLELSDDLQTDSSPAKIALGPGWSCCSFFDLSCWFLAISIFHPGPLRERLNGALFHGTSASRRALVSRAPPRATALYAKHSRFARDGRKDGWSLARLNTTRTTMSKRNAFSKLLALTHATELLTLCSSVSVRNLHQDDVALKHLLAAGKNSA